MKEVFKKLAWVVRSAMDKMFYLMTHSTHFIYGYMAIENKKNIWSL